ncbi:oxaloacetate acetylhydrolase [Gymnopus androsaceus JB14]|uniref:Oxaloacetate acetylhydrolase n=1 Tax=Gymnopus androsaceus JB14 TaxID=1447944 RepID=A0A6A4HRP1_9AGAR|nr:oxaloacetate acetylhydrolase [Gymnopus androsaceus JB14]
MEPYSNPRLAPENFREGPLSTNSATRLRQMLARPGAIIAPGIYDGVSARLALEAGFDCLYQSGAATTASKLGQPDLAMATLNDFVEAARMNCSIDPTVPLIADADTGFGGPNMIARTVKQYAVVGVAGLHIEDQVQTKRCGHLLGKQLVSAEDFVTRIRAAVLGRDSIPGGSDIVIIARTDAAQSLGTEEAINRLKLASAAGADLLFFEGIRSKEDLELAVQSLAPKPILLNVVAGGVTPNFTAKEAEALGAKLIIYPLITIVPAIHAMRESLQSLKRTGSDVDSAQGMGPRQFFQIMGLDDAIKFDTITGSTSLNMI